VRSHGQELRKKGCSNEKLRVLPIRLSSGQAVVRKGDLRIMKAISLHQPWASWIAEGKKTIETRFWPTKYRGDLLIVSTKKPKLREFPLGQALCVVSVVGCRTMTVLDETPAMCCWERGKYAWELENIRPIEPFEVKGKQGFYEVVFEERMRKHRGLFE